VHSKNNNQKDRIYKNYFGYNDLHVCCTTALGLWLANVRVNNMMQSETAHFVPGAATWRSRRNIYASSLIRAHSLYCVKTWRHP